MRIFIENGEIYSFAVTCWQGVFTLVLWLWNCGCSRVFACVFMMRLYGIILLQVLMTNLDQRMWNALKYFFGYAKYYSVTTMLTELNVQKFDTVIDKCRRSFQRQIHACENGIIQHFVYLHLMWLILWCIAIWLYSCILFVFLLLLVFFTVLWAHCLK